MKKFVLLLAGLIILNTACNPMQAVQKPIRNENIISTALKQHNLTALGCSITLPSDFKIDDSYQPYFIRFSSDDLDLKISRERSPYEDLDYYFNRYIYKYLLNETFQRVNEISLVDHISTTINGYKSKIVVLSRNTADSNNKSYYYHAILATGQRYFYMLNFKTSQPAEYRDVIKEALKSFTITKASPKGFNLKFQPDASDLGGEALDFYNKISASKQVEWGIFYPANLKPFEKFEELERKVNYQFPVMLHYIYLGHKFPKATLEQAHQNGKTVELTLQTMWSVDPMDTAENRNTMHSTIFDIIDGEYDEYLKSFAQQMKAFGHPVLFRLNNEMNGTWTVYSGIATMCDPDLFIEAWRHIYDIFQEEKVDNALWIFNPNDRDYPPLNWNNQVCYYPGDDYVHLIGVTGYNTGNYFEKKTGEKWRSFNEIYQDIYNKFRVMYEGYPWIVTEFACNSVGGDKQAWIKEMFDSMHRYPNIKIAVWWSYFDPDPETNQPARKYWLDEKEEYLMEFKKGLEKTKIKPF